MKKKGGANEGKGTKAHKIRSNKQVEGGDKPEITAIENDNHNQGFGEWLRSSDGVEMMRLFVIANSILVFVTMAWPNMQDTFKIVKEFFLGVEKQEENR